MNAHIATSYQPLVSLCLPTLNSIRHLEERLQSILGQSHTNWELIVVDSDSTDGTAERIAEMAKVDARVRLFRAPRGLYAAWNEALLHTRGDYIAIVPADDTMHPDCLDKAVRALERHPEVLMCHYCIECIDDQGKPLPGKWEAHGGTKSYGPLLHKEHKISPNDLVARLLRHGTVFASITELVVRRRLFSVAGLFPTHWGSAGDYAWQFRAVQAGPVLHLPELLATWRLHEGQASRHSLRTVANTNFRICQEMLSSQEVVAEAGPVPHWLQRAHLRRLHWKLTREPYPPHERLLDFGLLAAERLAGKIPKIQSRQKRLAGWIPAPPLHGLRQQNA